jgi:hypothetical protein
VNLTTSGTRVTVSRSDGPSGRSAPREAKTPATRPFWLALEGRFASPRGPRT